jgi:rhamnosyl/mannosyltransferase
MEYFLRDLARAQQAAGHQVHVLVHNHEKGQETRTEHAQGEEPAITRVHLIARLLFAPISPGFRSELERVLEGFSPDLLHLHLPNPSAFLLLTSERANRIPWVVQWQSDVLTPQSPMAIRLAYPFYRPFEQALLRKAKVIIAATPPYLETSHALSGHRSKCRVAPLGIDPQRIAACQSPVKHSTSKHALQLLAVGRLTYYKGFRYLLEAVSRLQGVTLTLVGDGDERNTLRRQIEQLGLKSRIHMLQNVDGDSLIELLRQSDALCLPSIERTEAFGLVLLEAMAHGKAVIATRVEGSGMGWIVRHEENGLLVEPRNVEELASAIERLDQDRPLLTRLGERGAEDFIKRFHIRSVTERMDEIYSTAT